MKTIFEKNLEAYERKYIKASEDYAKYRSERSEEEVIYADKDARGNVIYAVPRDGVLWYFDSRYDSKETARAWETRARDVNFSTIFIIFGMGNTDKINTVVKSMPSTCDVVIYEPDVEIFHRAFREIDMTELLSNRKVILCVKGLHTTLFREYLSVLMNYERVNYTRIMTLPNYDKLYKEDLEIFLAEIEDIYNNKMICCNTAKDLGREINEQCFRDMFYMTCSTTVDIAAETVKREGYDKKTAILVSGGPSLDKNVECLRKAKGKCFIFCVDTAIRSLLRRNIVPDAIITVDSHKPMELFEDERVNELPVVGCLQSRYEVLGKNRTKRILYANNHFAKSFYGRFGQEISTMLTHGSVANDGFYFLEFLGIKNIILIGQDCAYTDNRKHNADSYAESEFQVDETMFLVDGYYGGQVYTDLVFDNYRKFFELEIKKDSSLNVINATEGGARIEGAQMMPLEEAIEKYCTEEVDFLHLLSSLPDALDEQQKEEGVRYLCELTDEFLKLRDKLNSNYKDYESLLTKIGQDRLTSTELRKVLERIGKLNGEIDKNSLMEMVYLGASRDDYEVLENVYDTKEDAKEDVSEVCRYGMKLIKAYIREIDAIRENLAEVYKMYGYDC